MRTPSPAFPSPKMNGSLPGPTQQLAALRDPGKGQEGVTLSLAPSPCALLFLQV